MKTFFTKLLRWEVGLIIFVSFFFKVYRLRELLPIGWDQIQFYGIVTKMIVEAKPILIGPSVAAYNSFFLGPFWNYFLLPFFYLTKLDLSAFGYAYAFVWVLTSICIYFVGKKLGWGNVSALTITIVVATEYDRVVFNPIFIPLATLLALYCFNKIQGKNYKFFIWMWVVFAFVAQIHVSGAFLFSFLLVALLSLTTQKSLKNDYYLILKYNLVGFAIFCMTFAPLVIFDLRHDFLNLHGISNLFSGKNITRETFDYLGQSQKILEHFLRVVGFGFLDVFGSKYIVGGVILIVMSIYGIIRGCREKYLKIGLLTLVLFNFIGFLVYKSQISEYYFLEVKVALWIGLGYFLSTFSKRKNFQIFGYIFIAIFLIYKFFLLQNSTNFSSLYYKQKVVAQIASKNYSTIKINYDMSFGNESGFEVLLKKANVKIDTNSTNLVSIKEKFDRQPSQRLESGNFEVIYNIK